MPDLIDKGHLYVAQPPLYRVSAGKQELYIKDESEFNNYLLKRISEKEKIVLENGQEISGGRLVKLLSGVVKFYESLKKLSRRGYSARFIEFLASEGPTDKSFFKEEDFMEGLFDKLRNNGFRVQDVHLDEEGEYYEFLVTETYNGGQVSAVNWEFLSSPELRQVMGISKEFRELRKGKYILGGDGERKEINDPQQLLNDLMGRAKKGVTIQRYKGLGEMNPGQLWSTTMDPRRRVLLKVRIEDAVDADDMFTVLMGDKVEPRREFIQNNALEVTELDI
jgi:DNA gyrase subunit B